MPIDSVYGSKIRTIRRKLGNSPDLIVLGNESGTINYEDNPALGLVWARRMQAGGTFGKSFLVRGPTKPIAMTPGKPVVLGVDSDNVQRIMDVDFASIQSQGGNPMKDAVVDPNTNNPAFVNQQYITTAFPQIVDGTLKVGIRGWLIESAGTWYKVEGQANFTGNVPGAGEHCLALISVQNDFSTIEVQYSTPKDVQIPLDMTDLQEAWTATTSTNSANSAWDIGEDQTALIEANRWADLRQLVNAASSGSGSSFYQTLEVEGIAATQEPAFNFVAGANVTITATDDPGNTRTDVQIDISPSSLVSSKDLFVSTATATVANTATETSIIGSGVGSLTIPVDFMTAGKALKITVSGVWSTAALAPSLNIKLKLGSTVIVSTGAITVPVNLSNQLFTVEVLLTVRTAGSSGTVIAQGVFLNSEASVTYVAFIYPMSETSTNTIDTTTTQAVDVTATWGTASASNTISGTNMTLQTIDTENAGTGNVTGPASSVNNDIVVFNGTSGELIADSGLTIGQATAIARVRSAFAL